MGIEHVSWALRRVRNVDPNAKLILISIGNYADVNDRCFPSLAAIVEDTGLSESTVRRHIRQLCDEGALIVEARTSPRGRTQSNTYVINLRWNGAPNAPSGGGEEGCHGDTPTPVTVTPTGVTGDTPEGVNGDTPTSFNHQIEPSEKREEEARALESEFQKLVKAFKPGPTEAVERGRRLFAALEPADRALAVKHAAGFLAAMASEGKPKIAIATYLADRRWEAVAMNAAMSVTERNGGTIFVRSPSRAFDEWRAYHKARGTRFPVDFYSAQKGGKGWWFPTLFPPQADGSPDPRLTDDDIAEFTGEAKRGTA